MKDIIQYEGDNSTFVWKHECEDFSNGTQLIVHESQEALFMLNGQALDLFGPGKYSLTTQNMPELKRFINKKENDEEPFHSEVYFINKTEQMAIRWGTDSQVQYMDPMFNFPLSIGASGEMSLRVEDSRKLLVKLLGTEKVLTQENLVHYFRAFLMTKVKSYIAQTIKAEKINIFELDEKLQSLSEMLLQKLRPDFMEYGISLERFFVMNVVKPEGDPQYEQFKSLYFRQYADVAEAKLRQQVDIIDEQTKAQKIVIESQALAQKRAQEGYTYQEERKFDTADLIATNKDVGQFTNIGIGLNAMNSVSSQMTETMNNVLNGNKQRVCAKCGTNIGNAKFCPECGEKYCEQTEAKCSACGASVKNAKFCPECGNKL